MISLYPYDDGDGFGAGAPGYAAHRIFVSAANVQHLDGQPFELSSLDRQPARGRCDVCYAWAVTLDYPTLPWRHATTDETDAITALDAIAPAPEARS